MFPSTNKECIEEIDQKETLADYGFRLPSALDNRPLRFDEWESMSGQKVFVSATPGEYEDNHLDQL